MSPDERMAAELALIPALFMRAWSAVTSTIPAATRVAADLIAASQEPLAGLDPNGRATARGHIDRLVEEADERTKRPDRLGLAAFYLTKMLRELEVFDQGSGPLARALDAIMPALNPINEIDVEHEIARKQATRILRDAQRRGLFTDIPPEITA